MNQDRKGQKSGKQKMLIGIVCVALVLAAAVLLFWKIDSGKPVLSLEIPQKISAGSQEPITLDLSISDFGEAKYPAASFRILFDSSRLEFLGLEEGNVFVTDTPNAAGIAQKLPTWQVNPEKSNQTGQISIMYLDLTGGTSAFSRELLRKEENVVLRLSFRLRGSARPGDVCPLTVADAVFAASDSTQSLAMTQKTLSVRDSKIVVGE